MNLAIDNLNKFEYLKDGVYFAVRNVYVTRTIHLDKHIVLVR